MRRRWAAISIDVKSVAKSFDKQVTQKSAQALTVDLKTAAARAGRRQRVIKPRHSKKTYRYSNTGQLAANIATRWKADKAIVSDGGRAYYSKYGYHGMYFLVEKRGEREVQKAMKDLTKYVESLKL